MNRRGQQAFPPHGTIQGYRAHLRWGPPPCDECREANRLRTAARRSELVECVECGEVKPRAWHNRCDWCAKLYVRNRRKKKKVKRVPVAINGDQVPQAPGPLPDPGAA